MTHWLKTRTLLEKTLLTVGCSMAALAAVFCVFPRQGHEVAALPDPPQILDVSLFTIGAPKTGSIVTVEAASGALGGSIRAVYCRNVTLGGSWVMGDYFDPTAEVALVAGVGDLLEFKAEDPNETPSEDTAIIGIVPAQTDSARPDFDAAKFAPSGTFAVEISTAAVFDQSWPVTVALGLHGQSFADTDTLTSSNGSTNTNTVTLTMTAASGDRCVLRLTDNYGNRSELHFIVGTPSSQASSDVVPDLEDYRPPGTFCDAERTGLAPVAGHGVLLQSRNFVHSQDVLQLRGEVLDLGIVLTYRSTMAYDGPVGQGWDWNLDSRLTELDQLEYWPGDGQVHEGLSYDAPYAPPGIFLLPELPGSLATLTDASGRTLIFDKNLLTGVEDVHGNEIVVHRYEDGDRIAEVIDDLGRITSFAWFNTGRLAEIVDFGGRRTRFDYDASGNLVRITRPDGSFLSYGYTSGLLTEVYEATAPNDTPVLAILNTYSSGVVTAQRDRYNMLFGQATLFSSLNPTGQPTPAYPTWGINHVRVTDPAGNCIDYGFADRHPSNEEFGELRVVRHHQGALRASAPWSSNPDPAWVESWLEIDLANLLPATRYHRHANQGTNPPDLEREEWSFDWDQDAPIQDSEDPRGRALVTEHSMVGDGSGATFTAVTCYDEGNHPFHPTQHTDLNGVVTLTTFGLGGQLLSRLVEGVTPAQQTTPYDILQTYTYDAQGRITGATNPNRHHAEGPDPEPSVTYEYHSSGLQAGRLHRVEHLDETGTPRLWTEFTYDPFGNVLSQEDQSGRETHFTYDLLDRRSTSSYTVTLTSPTVVATHTTTNTYEGDDLSEVSETFYDVATTSNVTVVMARSSEELTTSTTPYKTIRERALEAGSPVVYSKDVTIHDVRGLPTSTLSYTSSTAYTARDTYYDALGQVYKTVVDPSTASGDEQVDYYAYNHAGRQTEHYSTHWDQPARTIHDAYGRSVQEISTRVVLGRPYDEVTDEYDANQVGYFTTLTLYDDANGKPQQVADVKRYVLHDESPSAPSASGWSDFTGHLLIARDQYTYDEAGRSIGHEQQVDSSSVSSATTETEFYPGGQVRRRYLPEDAASTVYSTLTELDALDRVITEEDETGLNLEITTYGTDGHVASRTRRDYDEVAESTTDYIVKYAYDELGRVIQELRDVSGATDIATTTAYDGRGRVIRTVNVQGSLLGIITAREYDLGGRQTRERRGYDLTSGLYSEVKHGYDLKGRRISEKQLRTLTGGAQYFETSYTYDGADRTVTETLPPFGGTGGTRVRSYAYGFDEYHGSIDLPFTQVTQPNGAVLVSLENQLGHTLHEVSDPSSAATVAGPALVEYLYAGPSSCGCTRDGKPIEIRTAHDPDEASAGDTIVRRAYDKRGMLLQDYYRLYTGGPAPGWTAAAGSLLEVRHDARGSEIQVTYPDGAELAKTLRADGRPTLLDLDRGGGSRRILEHSYAGRAEIFRHSFNGAGYPVLIARGGATLDVFGRRQSVTYDNGAQTPVLIASEEVLEYDPDGRMLERERMGTATDIFQYTGDGWLADEVWDDNGPNERTRTWTRNHAGHVLKFTDTLGSIDWDYVYASSAEGAAGLVTSITGTVVLATEVELQFDPFFSPPPPGTPPSVSMTLSDREFTYDKSGQLTEAVFELSSTMTCSTGPWAGVAGWYDLDEAELTENHTYDAWGKLIEWEREVTGGTYSACICDDAPESKQCDPEDESAVGLTTLTRRHIYDGLGRRVQTEVSGEYIAFLDTEVPTNQHFGASGLVAVDASVIRTPWRVRRAFLASNEVQRVETRGGAERTIQLYRASPPGKGRIVDGTDDALVTELPGVESPSIAGNGCDAGAEEGTNFGRWFTFPSGEEAGDGGGCGLLLVHDPDGDETTTHLAGTCGAIADKWLVEELQSQAAGLARASQGEVINNAHDYAQWANGNQRYKDPAYFEFSKGTACGTGNCGRSVTLCGLCVRSAILGNIVYGIMGSFLGIEESRLIEVADQYKSHVGVDTFDHAAYSLGAKLANALRKQNLRPRNLTTEAVCKALTESAQSNPDGLKEGKEEGGHNDLSGCIPCTEETKETRHGGNEKKRLRP